MTDDSISEQVAQAYQALAFAGQTDMVWGHVSARDQLTALAAGGPMRWSDEAEIAEKRVLVWSMSQYQAGYDYLSRRASAAVSDDPITA